MNLLKRKMPLFCISNIMVSFVCTGFLGTNYYNASIESEQSDGESIALVDDVIPLSQKESKEESVKKETKTTKKTTTAKKTVSKVTQKAVKSSVTYAPAKYNAVTGNAVVEYAKRYLGLRYVSGGYSLTSGTDCSGFTKLIYKEFGVNLSRVVSGQIKSGTYVSKGDLQKGDLVFYSSGGSKATHVAIYVGNGSVIHESNHRDGVKYSSVNMMRYITARRVINSTANKIAEEKVNSEKKEEIINTPLPVVTSTPVPDVTSTPVPVITEENKETVGSDVKEESVVSTPTPTVTPTEQPVSKPSVETKESTKEVVENNMDKKEEKKETTTPTSTSVSETNDN